MVLCKFFTLIVQKNNEKKNNKYLTKAITTKQAYGTVNKTTSKSKGTKLKKENKFLTHFKPIFPLAPEKIFGLEKGNIGSKCVKFLADLVLSLLV